jgi:hypothetical protein
MTTDRALWVTWCDVPEAGRDDYLAWLHGSYIPAVLKRPGYLWAAHYASVKKNNMTTMRREKGILNTADASVPPGEDFMLFFGAADTAVFGACSPAEINAALPEAERKMLARRSNERINILVEAARVEGPELPGYAAGMQLAPCIQMGQFNCTPGYEEEMMAWYARWRMPALSRTPGCIRTRKLASVAGWAKHAILYEFTSLAARNEHFTKHEDGHHDMIAWGDKMVAQLTHAPGSANLAQRIWPGLAV